MDAFCEILSLRKYSQNESKIPTIYKHNLCDWRQTLEGPSPQIQLSEAWWL